MDGITIKKRVETTINVLVVLVSITLVGIFIRHYFFRPENVPPTGTMTPGTKLSGLEKAGLSNQPQSLVLFLSTDCKYCLHSIPFYQKLIEANKTGTRHTPIIAVFSNDKADVDNYLRIHKLEIPTLTNADYSEIKIPKTPSIVLVDNTGKIVKSWAGELTPGNQEKVLGLIN